LLPSSVQKEGQSLQAYFFVMSLPRIIRTTSNQSWPQWLGLTLENIINLDGGHLNPLGISTVFLLRCQSRNNMFHSG
jgi:hypothetical protein